MEGNEEYKIVANICEFVYLRPDSDHPEYSDMEEDFVVRPSIYVVEKLGEPAQHVQHGSRLTIRKNLKIDEFELVEPGEGDDYYENPIIHIQGTLPEVVEQLNRLWKQGEAKICTHIFTQGCRFYLAEDNDCWGDEKAMVRLKKAKEKRVEYQKSIGGYVE
jgi:hypothetical protein